MRYLVEKDGERQLVQSLDGYDDWTQVDEVDDDDPVSALVAVAALTADDAGTMAEHRVTTEAEAIAAATSGDMRRQSVILSLWDELQRLKLASLVANGVPSALEERRKAFPGLMALVALSGRSLTTVATEVDARLWERVRQLHLAHAKLMLAHDAIRTATTAEAKLAASDVDWTQGV